MDIEEVFGYQGRYRTRMGSGASSLLRPSSYRLLLPKIRSSFEWVLRRFRYCRYCSSYVRLHRESRWNTRLVPGGLVYVAGFSALPDLTPPEVAAVVFSPIL